MPRVKKGITKHRRHREMVKAAKGYRGLRHRLYKQAKTARLKAGVYAYEHRRQKKRTFRRLWITRINAALRAQGMKYSRFVKALEKKNIKLDRKILAELAANEPAVFQKIVEMVK